MLELSTPVQYVKGVGPRIGEVLAAKGIHTVGDLLHYLPFRYEDRLNPRGISELRAGEMATVVGEVRNSGTVSHARQADFSADRWARTGSAALLVVQRDLFAGQVPAGADDRAVWQGGRGSRSRELQIVQPQFEVLGDPTDSGGERCGEEGRGVVGDWADRSDL